MSDSFWKAAFYEERTWWLRHAPDSIWNKKEGELPSHSLRSDCPTCHRSLISMELLEYIRKRIGKAIFINTIILSLQRKSLIVFDKETYVKLQDVEDTLREALKNV